MLEWQVINEPFILMYREEEEKKKTLTLVQT